MFNNSQQAKKEIELNNNKNYFEKFDDDFLPK